MQDPDSSRLPTPPADATETVKSVVDEPTLKFTNVMNNLQTVYPRSMMDDISTSFCFISLLHLANEQGLIIEKTPDLTELNIRKDWTAEVTAE